MIWIFSKLGDRAASLDITWYHWPCHIDITKYRFYMAARIDKIVISELDATDPRVPDNGQTVPPSNRESHSHKHSQIMKIYPGGTCSLLRKMLWRSRDIPTAMYMRDLS